MHSVWLHVLLAADSQSTQQSSCCKRFLSSSFSYYLDKLSIIGCPADLLPAVLHPTVAGQLLPAEAAQWSAAGAKPAVRCLSAQPAARAILAPGESSRAPACNNFCLPDVSAAVLKSISGGHCVQAAGFCKHLHVTCQSNVFGMEEVELGERRSRHRSRTW